MRVSGSHASRSSTAARGAKLKIAINPQDDGDNPATAHETLCGARARSGSTCERLPEPGRRRCRLHGGAKGSGAPSGTRNGRYADGHHTKEAKAERRLVQQILSGSGEGHMTTNDNATPASESRERRLPVSAQVYRSGGAGEFSVRAPAGQTKKEWTVRLRKALGSQSKTFVDACLHRLITACCLPRQLLPTSTSVSAALALIESLEPRNEIEAVLAVQIACLHAASGNLLSRLAWATQDRPTMSAANATAKIERALHSAINIFYRVKHGNTQVIRIERLEIQSGAQAVVGMIGNGRPMG